MSINSTILRGYLHSLYQPPKMVVVFYWQSCGFVSIMSLSIIQANESQIISSGQAIRYRIFFSEEVFLGDSAWHNRLQTYIYPKVYKTYSGIYILVLYILWGERRRRCNSFCILLRVMRNNDCPVFFPSGMITINLNNGCGFYDIFFLSLPAA